MAILRTVMIAAVDDWAKAHHDVVTMLQQAQKRIIVRMLDDGLRPKGPHDEDDLQVSVYLLEKAAYRLRAMSGYGAE